MLVAVQLIIPPVGWICRPIIVYGRKLDGILDTINAKTNLANLVDTVTSRYNTYQHIPSIHTHTLKYVEMPRTSKNHDVNTSTKTSH